MKLYLRIGMLLVMLSVLFVSCTKESDPTYDVGLVPAVVTNYMNDTTHIMVASTSYGKLYATTFSSYSAGKCLLVDFSYQPKQYGNSKVGENGYYTVSVVGTTAVDQYTALSSLSDTTKLLSNELPVVAPVYSGYAHYFTCLEGFLFFPSVYLTTLAQTSSWQLSYSTTAKNESVGSVYNFYLRSSASAAPDSAATDTLLLDVNAFNINDFITKAGITADEFYARIHYVYRINASDSSDFTWRETDPILIKRR